MVLFMKFIALLFLYFMIYSFLGWLVESIYIFISQHKWLNRGFLIGPYCPIYGVGALAIILISKYVIKYPLLLFLLSVLFCSMFEYLASFLLERIFNVRLWDYSKRKYNLNGRICLATTVLFGIGGVLVAYFIQPYLSKLILLIPQNIIYIIVAILLIIFVIDIIISSKIIINLKNNFSKIVKDNTKEIKDKVKEIFKKRSYFVKRFLSSFPNIKNTIKKYIDK